MHTERLRSVLCTRTRDESLLHSAHKQSPRYIGWRGSAEGAFVLALITPVLIVSEVDGTALFLPRIPSLHLLIRRCRNRQSALSSLVALLEPLCISQLKEAFLSRLLLIADHVLANAPGQKRLTA
jgi:hypothetical protein